MSVKQIQSKQEFDDVVKGTKPVLVDFYAEWCGPCQIYGPMIEDFSESYKNKDKVEIIKVDVDQVSEVSGEFNVMSIPTTIIFKDGKALETMVGVQSPDNLGIKLDKLI